eukprot:scaffold2361_cov390-Prasinococcus_capsulatus_cf.AAC.2
MHEYSGGTSTVQGLQATAEDPLCPSRVGHLAVRCSTLAPATSNPLHSKCQHTAGPHATQGRVWKPTGPHHGHSDWRNKYQPMSGCQRRSRAQVTSTQATLLHPPTFKFKSALRQNPLAGETICCLRLSLCCRQRSGSAGIHRHQLGGRDITLLRTQYRGSVRSGHLTAHLSLTWP